MKLSLQWLRDYAAITAEPAEVEQALTLLGFEVDAVESFGLALLPNVVVGEVLSYVQHPNAERLRYCEVEVGAGTPAKIVCGAKNFAAGDRVPVALPGALLPGGRLIERAALRGVVSEGMLCSAEELGLPKGEDGLLILDGRPPVGQPLNELYGPADTVFTLEVTPNRPDCLCHLGLARELAAWFGTDLTYPEVGTVKADPGTAGLLERLVVEDPERCPQYRAYSVRGVKVGPSPRWLRRALESIGLRPINNVVDATNFVLHETGQPLHAFDAAKIGGGAIVVRLARPGETLTTLDGQARALDERDLLIADAARPLVVAGIMGGLDSGVTEATTDVLLECALFEPKGIRRTGRRLGLSSDSAYRYERGVDPCGGTYAALRALDLICQLTGGRLSPEVKVEGNAPVSQREILIDEHYVGGVLGWPVAQADLAAKLEALELGVEEVDGSARPTALRVSIPSFRADLERPIDLVEEFLRLSGTHRIPAAGVLAAVQPGGDAPLAQLAERAQRHLVGLGFVECVHYTLRSAAEVESWAGHAAAAGLTLANPMTADQAALRTTLLPGLLDALRLNRDAGNTDGALFEVGRVFTEANGVLAEHFAVAFAWGAAAPQGWRARPAPDLFQAKAVLESLAGALGLATALRPADSFTGFEPGYGAAAAGEGWAAKLGAVAVAHLRAWGLDEAVFAGELHFDPARLPPPAPPARFAALPTLPATVKDLALVMPAERLAADALADLRTAVLAEIGAEAGLEAVELFDVFTGPGLPPGHKSLAFSLRLRGAGKTLTDDWTNGVLKGVQARLTAGGIYTIRGAAAA